MTIELSFGKYKGQSIEDVFKNDPGYCRWIHNQPSLNISEKMKIFLHSRFLNNDNSYMMTWGKYRGKSLQQISKLDPGYLDWLRKSQFGIDKCPKLLKELN
ncbi:hypothetical protein PHYSODRAFT_518880 [Phytophthora sojae]|uniref:Exodeoxyribonuclease X-like C-terminal domain-containing protein n=1 Tax=Phytophthora sojae (strain P6497) TaxID=1094619 RepID=G5A080_PHYSP|nr:hypothetical protein PHYSODRAFT_518586 [Phytophthora sojae]XP_009534068.1 hypothetical protein PHYSODRAFT_518880 [Phytophthora sojae]EGZ11228.1 hypothetical protein PHYSODRAFT_518586 [Phytophthora sojae]EGZ11323.1 hypothetical protein PHYSODRAFT_518880 [Phytophthora sojae]|eukprot:XP_009533973.1 hypothetical protein PHYSODRAFT_518586 [Phytophthora sojae]